MHFFCDLRVITGSTAFFLVTKRNSADRMEKNTGIGLVAEEFSGAFSSACSYIRGS